MNESTLIGVLLCLVGFLISIGGAWHMYHATEERWHRFQR